MAQGSELDNRKGGEVDAPFTVRLLISWGTNALVLALVGLLLPRVSFSDAGSVILAAAVFGVLNTIVKPVLRLLTLPFAILTLGIAWFFVSLFMLLLTRWLVSGFEIRGFLGLIEATVIVWAVNVVLDFVPGPWQLCERRDLPERAVAVALDEREVDERHPVGEAERGVPESLRLRHGQLLVDRPHELSILGGPIGLDAVANHHAPHLSALPPRRGPDGAVPAGAAPAARRHSAPRVPTARPQPRAPGRNRR
jgi:putative membrane protein